MASDAVADVRERTDIVDLVSSYVPLKKAGRNFKGLCPFHQEKTPSFIVFPDSGNFKCFGCGKGGDVFTFYKEIERVEFREALEELARRAGIELKSAPPPSPERDAHRQTLIELNELAATYFASQLRSGAPDSPGQRMVQERGISREIVEAFQIGLAPDAWDKLTQFFATRGVDPDRAVDAGLLNRRDTGGYYDRFRNRLMFPIRDRDGRVVGFGGRAFGDEQPKYLNTPQTEVFDKSHIVYALDRAREEVRRRDQAVVVEGYMDVLAAHQFGYRNVVASMGTAITESQLAQLKRYSKNVILALDADVAGQAAMMRALEALPTGESDSAPVTAKGLIFFEKRLSVNISILALPLGKDPDEMIRADPERWPAVVDAARPFMAFYIDQIAAGVENADPRAKGEAVERAAPLLALLPDGVEVSHYVEVLARQLRMADLAPIREAVRVERRKQRASLAERPVIPLPRRSSVEDHLIALILTYPSVLNEFAFGLDPNAITDARNRELLLGVVPDRPGAVDIGDSAYHLEEHRGQLVASLSELPAMNRILVQRDAQQALERQLRERNEYHLRELRNVIAGTDPSDLDSLMPLVRACNDLAIEKNALPPRESPVFPDSRTPRAVRKSKIKVME